MISEGDARLTASHLGHCAVCQREVETLRRLRVLLQRHATVPEPDWTSLWPSIVRGIEDTRRAVPRRAPSHWIRPTWALGGVLAATLLISLTVWQILPDPLSTEPTVVVRSASTDYPNGAVMVYSAPGQDVTVVWLLDASE